MIEATQPAGNPPVRRRARTRRALGSNVVQLHQRLLPRHSELLARWLEAGRQMGLCDATTFAAERRAGRAPASAEYVLVWVRENMDPAYIIRPDRIGWLVIDALRENELGRTRSFAAALHMIRPVLKLDEAA